MKQEFIALTIVSLTATLALFPLARAAIGPPLALWLLRHGKTKFAFWVRKYSQPSTKGCSGCKKC